MLRIFMLLFGSFVAISVGAQDNWGYCFVRVTVQAKDGTEKDYMFVSELMNLKSLKGDSEITLDTSRNEIENQKRIVDKCIVDWFYSRLKEVNPNEAPFLYREDIIADTRFFSNLEFMEKYMVGGHDYFLSRSDAEQRRGHFLNIIKSNNRSEIVIVK